MEKILNYKTEKDIKEVDKIQASLYQRYDNVKAVMYGIDKVKIIYY